MVFVISVFVWYIVCVSNDAIQVGTALFSHTTWDLSYFSDLAIIFHSMGDGLCKKCTNRNENKLTKYTVSNVVHSYDGGLLLCELVHVTRHYHLLIPCEYAGKGLTLRMLTLGYWHCLCVHLHVGDRSLQGWTSNVSFSNFHSSEDFGWQVWFYRSAHPCIYFSCFLCTLYTRHCVSFTAHVECCVGCVFREQCCQRESW